MLNKLKNFSKSKLGAVVVSIVALPFVFFGMGSVFQNKDTNNIAKINKLYDEGNEIIYYTARGTVSKINWYDITKDQLDSWGCKYHDLSVGEKPHYDLLICDKTKRIEEI